MKKEKSKTPYKKMIIHILAYSVVIFGMILLLRPDLFWSHKGAGQQADLVVLERSEEPDFEAPEVSEKFKAPLADGLYQIDSDKTSVGWSIETKNGPVSGIFTDVTGVLSVEGGIAASSELRVDPQSIRVFKDIENEKKIRGVLLEKLFDLKEFPEIKVALTGARGPRDMDGLYDMGATFSLQGSDLSVAFAGSIFQDSRTEIVIDTLTPLRFSDLGVDTSILGDWEIGTDLTLDPYLVFKVR